MFLQAFNIFVGLQVMSIQCFIDSFDDFFESPISCMIIIRYFGESLCYLVHIDFDFFFSNCTVVIDRSKSGTSSVRSFSSFIMLVIHFATASSSNAVCGFSSSIPLKSIFGSDSVLFFVSVGIHWSGTKAFVSFHPARSCQFDCLSIRYAVFLQCSAVPQDFSSAREILVIFRDSCLCLELSFQCSHCVIEISHE